MRGGKSVYRATGKSPYRAPGGNILTAGVGKVLDIYRDPGQGHKAPGINKMAAERDRLFVGELAGRSRLSDNIDGVDGIEASDAARSPQVSGADQVGLLKISHPVGGEIGIRRAAAQSADFDLFRLSGPGEDLFDRRDRRQETEPPSIELEVDRFCPDAGEGRSSALMGRQFIAESQDLTNKSPAGLVSDMFRRPASVTKSVKAGGSKAPAPFGQPKSSTLDFSENLTKPDSLSKKPDRPDPTLILTVVPHRPTLLPFRMGRSLGDAILVCDVLTVF